MDPQEKMLEEDVIISLSGAFAPPISKSDSHQREIPTLVQQMIFLGVGDPSRLTFFGILLDV